MSSSTLDKNRRLVRRYTNQPETLPSSIRAAVEKSWDGEPVQLYALSDIDARLRLRERWILLGPTKVAVAEPGSGNGDLTIRSYERDRIRHVTEVPGLSCTVARLQETLDDSALLTVRFTHRQRQAMGAILFVLKHRDLEPELDDEDGDEVYAESVAEPIKKAQASVAASKVDVLWRLLTYLKPYKARFAAGVMGAAMLTLLSLIPPQLTGFVIDRVAMPYLDGEIAQDAALRLGLTMLGILVGVYVIREVFLWIRLKALAEVGELVARDLRTSIYDHLHKLSVNYFSSRHTGSLISRVSSDTDRIWDFIAFGVAEMILSILMILGLSGVLLWEDWRLGLILIIPVPLLFLGIYLMGRKLHRIFLRIWHKWSEMTAVLSDTIPGMRVVQAFDQGDHERARFEEKSGGVTTEAFGIIRVWTTMWPIIVFGLSLMMIIVWVVALPRMIGYGPPLTPGEFTKFVLYMGMYVMPIENFGFLTRMINRSLSSAHRVFEVLDSEPEIVDRSDAKRLEPVEGRIAFEDVVFGYDAVRQILKGVSFEVEPGEMIGLVGPSGAGKTTVINLMARFYDAQSGVVRIDGVDVRDLEVGHYRRQIGMVMQDPYLFRGSILENIRYGLHDATTEQVVASARAANAHDFICKLTQGYDTVVGERGHTLSGGERQRVSIARAILHNPRLLILDEATSSVDTETERNIQEALDRLVEGRTVIAIAHRLSTLRRATRLFVMKEGRLVEQGSHEELLAKKDGVYRKLYDMQQELHELYAV